jgi:hypothetical protein
MTEQELGNEMPSKVELDTRIEQKENFLNLIKEAISNDDKEELKKLFGGAYHNITMKRPESYDAEGNDTPEFTKIKETYLEACADYTYNTFIGPIEQNPDEELV